MKIAYFTDAYRPKIDGVSVSCENLANELVKRNIEFDLYAPETPGIYKDPEYIYRFTSVPVAFQPEFRFSFPIDRKSLFHLRQTEYSLIHSNSPGSLGFLALEAAKVREVPHFHTLHTFLPNYTHYVFGGKVLTPAIVAKLMVAWCGWMDYLIAPSPKIQKWLLKNGVTRDIQVIPSGIETARFKQNLSANYFVDHGYIQRGDFALMYAGRFGKEKAIDLLINYFGQVPNVRGSAIKLIIVGDGPICEELREQVRELDLTENVIFTGYVEPQNMYLTYRSASALTFLSTTETQGMVVTEAIASGLPVIVSKDDAFSGMVVQGKNGFIVSSVTEYISAVNSLVKNPTLVEKMGEYSLRLSQSFDIQNTTQKILDYYQFGIDRWKKEKHAKRSKTRLTLDELNLRLQETVNEIKSNITEYV